MQVFHTTTLKSQHDCVVVQVRHMETWSPVCCWDLSSTVILSNIIFSIWWIVCVLHYSDLYIDCIKKLDARVRKADTYSAFLLLAYWPVYWSTGLLAFYWGQVQRFQKKSDCIKI